MTDKDFLNIWERSSGEGISQSEIGDAYSKVSDRMERIEGHSGNRTYSSKLRKIFLYSFGAAAAIAAIAFLSISAYRFSRPSEALAVAEPIEYLEVRTGLGEAKDLTLPDSSKITLNSGSLIIYPDKFSGAKRNVYLTGEAVFDVTHDDQKPFEVSTADFIVKVHGTKFNVSAYADDEKVSTTLCRGSVSVLSRNDGQEFDIRPDQQFIFDKGSGEVAVKGISSQEEISWTSDKLCFNSASIRDMARKVERRFGVKIYIATSKYDDSVITAKFIHGESLKDILNAISKLVPGMKWRRNQQGEIFIS
jgi:ferric-dicitrate binding protein FerR (iron transport regulator)